MKEVKANRFQKNNSEEITFQGTPIVDGPPSIKQSNGYSSERSDDRTDEKTQVAPRAGYSIERPRVRRKIRHSFDIFEDQKNALEKIQLAMREERENKKPLLGNLVQEALDKYIRQKAKGMESVYLIEKNT